MKNINVFVVIIIIGLLTTIGFACDKPDDNDDTPPEEQTELIFTSLTADKDSIYANETLDFTAVASGKDITYKWTVSIGSFLGSGNKVTYTPSACTAGDVTVSCVVKDSYGKTKSKTKTVHVK
ncbi:MAG: PKD domain-containing protein [Bacteroidales bacterium]|nr:PKD domain-containing protein [Bacteroidales bacterium]